MQEGLTMNHASVLGLASLLWLCGAGWRNADEPKPPTPVEEFQAILKEAQQAQEEFRKAYGAAKTDEERQRVLKESGTKSSVNSPYFADKFLELIRNHPKDPAALDAFRRLLAMGDGPQNREAAKLVIDHWIENERIADVCKSLVYYSGDAGDTLLRAAIVKSPHRTVQGYARFALGLSLKARADRLGNARPADRAPYEREAEQLFQQVIEKYADLKYSPKPTLALGRAAEAELFELQHLAIGKVAPDIEAEDLDGKRMKLSDYRGKIVLLDFWGSW
jgi:AhpC/TSA family